MFAFDISFSIEPLNQGHTSNVQRQAWHPVIAVDRQELEQAVGATVVWQAATASPKPP